MCAITGRAGSASRAVGARRSRRLLSLRDTARAMSQENVEIVRRAIEAFKRGDRDACSSIADPDFEFDPIEDGRHAVPGP